MSSDLIELVSRIASARVLCVGDVMLDRFITGEVARISPEAPVPVLRIQRETAMLGGAGNVARNVAALGGKVTLMALTGDDTAADEKYWDAQQALLKAYTEGLERQARAGTDVTAALLKLEPSDAARSGNMLRIAQAELTLSLGGGAGTVEGAELLDEGRRPCASSSLSAVAAELGLQTAAMAEGTKSGTLASR